MSINAISDVMRCGPIFRGAEKGVLLALANNADEHGLCRPSIKEIAWNSGLNERTVQRALFKLENLGVLEITETGGGRRANRYRLNIEWLEKAAAAIYRTKLQALQNGGDRYLKMGALAGDLRAALEAERDLDPVRGPRHRSHQPAVKSGAPGAAPSLTPGVTPGVGPGKNFIQEHNAAPPLASCPLEAASGHPIPGVRPPEPSINSFEPSGETSTSEDRALELPLPQTRTGRKLGESKNTAGSGHHTKASGSLQSVADCKTSLDTVNELANALSLKANQVCLTLGSLSVAEKLATQWQDGAIDLETVRAELAKLAHEVG